MASHAVINLYVDQILAVAIAVQNGAPHASDVARLIDKAIAHFRATATTDTDFTSSLDKLCEVLGTAAQRPTYLPAAKGVILASLAYAETYRRTGKAAR